MRGSFDKLGTFNVVRGISIYNVVATPNDVCELLPTGLTFTRNSLVGTSGDGIILNQSTNASAINPVRISPRLRLNSRVWNTTGAGSAETSDWIIENLPTSGTTPSSLLKFGYSRNGGTYSYPMTLSSVGNLTCNANLSLTGGSGVFSTSVANGIFYPGLDSRGNIIQRNVNDAYTTQTINNLHASSTGNILDLQWQSVNRISFTKNGSINLNTTDALGAGTINIAGNRFLHAYAGANATSFANLFIGRNSGNFTSDGAVGENYKGTGNIGIGEYTLVELTSGFYNVTIGASAGRLLTTGNSNFIAGHQAGYNISSGSGNFLMGRDTALSITTGSNNVAIGGSALRLNSSGSTNIAIGNRSLSNSTVSNLTAIGADSLTLNTTGTGLVAVGYQAGKYNVKGTNNSYFGYQAGYSGTTVVSSITITNGGTGYTAGALIVNNTGTGGTGLAGTYTVDGSGVINGITITNNGSGYNSAPVVTPQAGGSSAVLTAVLSSAIENTAFGYKTLYANTSGRLNTAVGSNVLVKNTTGVENTGFGYNTLVENTTGSYNMGIGSNSLYKNVSGDSNTAVGYASLYSNTGNNNTSLGVLSGRNQTSGNYNIYIGSQSAWKSGVTATGSGNVFMGFQTGINATGSYNIFSGYMAGKYETGSYKIFIDNRDRTDEATARTNSLIYGVTDATPANQTLAINGVLTTLGYKSSDGSAGITVTKVFMDGAVTNTVTIKDGIITGWTQV